MSDDNKERGANLKALTQEKYNEIGEIVMPTDLKELSNRDRAVVVLAGQIAIGLAVCGNIAAMTKAGAVEQATGDKLLARYEALSIEMHEAFHAAAEEGSKKRGEQRAGTNVVDGCFGGDNKARH